MRRLALPRRSLTRKTKVNAALGFDLHGFVRGSTSVIPEHPFVEVKPGAPVGGGPRVMGHHNHGLAICRFSHPHQTQIDIHTNRPIATSCCPSRRTSSNINRHPLPIHSGCPYTTWTNGIIPTSAVNHVRPRVQTTTVRQMMIVPATQAREKRR